MAAVAALAWDRALSTGLALAAAGLLAVALLLTPQLRARLAPLLLVLAGLAAALLLVERGVAP
jgi:hypothetical protein